MVKRNLAFTEYKGIVCMSTSIYWLWNLSGIFEKMLCIFTYIYKYMILWCCFFDTFVNCVGSPAASCLRHIASLLSDFFAFCLPFFSHCWLPVCLKLQVNVFVLGSHKWVIYYQWVLILLFIFVVLFCFVLFFFFALAAFTHKSVSFKQCSSILISLCWVKKFSLSLANL